MAVYIVSNLLVVDLLVLVVTILTFSKLYQIAQRRVRTTKLKGPPSSSWFFGNSKKIFQGDSGEIHENWAKEYGSVYQVPAPFGGRRVVLMDAKAISHFYTRETFTYVNSTFSKRSIANIVGKGLLWAEGESHRRQRKTLTPAFSNAAIRNLTPVFYDSAYKVKAAWDAILSSEEKIINVQKWMNCISLDSIGIAGFGHNFGALDGRPSTVEEVFDTFGTLPPLGISILIPILGIVFPILAKIPNDRSRLVKRLHNSMEEISKVVLERSRQELEVEQKSDSELSKSIIGALLKAENSNLSNLRLTPEEVLAQMKVLILAGYETTSISLTWALIELSLHPEKQDKLRTELSEFANSDPTYDQFSNGLPYLDSVFREVLRLHPPLSQTFRIAAHDDVIPLNEPVVTASGEKVNSITIAKGTSFLVPIRAMNRSEDIWGPDAKEFKPERWLNGDSGINGKAKDIQGYHHILSFIDGPRMCLGRAFATAEFKSVLSVLIRNYKFSLRDGPETKIDMITTILPRPKVAGEEGSSMPMRVQRYEY